MRRLTRSQIIRYATAYDTLTRTVDETVALLAGCVPCELAATQADTLDLSPATFDVMQGGMVPWEGTLTIEGRMTGDGRWIDSGALRWENLPLPLRYAPEDEGGHSGAVVVGSIDTVERLDDGRIWGTGFIDLATEEGREAARGLDTRQMRGVSVDMDDVSFEIRVAAELLEREEELDEADEANELPPGPVDDEGRITVIAIDAGDEVFATTGGRIRAATIVAIPAFIDAELRLSDREPMAAGGQSPLPFLVAAAAPVDPPKAWFTNPNLPGPTRTTVTDDGRTFGHIAEWGTCHRSHTAQGRCITPPYSSTGYAHFMCGTLKTSEGDLIAVGSLTMGTGHAALVRGMSESAVKAHYENTGTVAADVVVGEDAYGIWFSGAIRPNLTAAQIREFRAATQSGDWRPVGGSNELVASLAVPTGGFPIMPKGLVAGGMMQGLVAAGVLDPDTPRGVLSDDDMDLLRELAVAERERRNESAPVVVNVDTDGIMSRAAALSLALRVRGVSA